MENKKQPKSYLDIIKDVQSINNIIPESLKETIKSIQEIQKTVKKSFPKPLLDTLEHVNNLKKIMPSDSIMKNIQDLYNEMEEERMEKFNHRKKITKKLLDE